MKFSAAEIIQIAIGLIQIALGFISIKRQSQSKQESDKTLDTGNFTFWNTIEKFDLFSLFVSLGCLCLAATISLPSFPDWSDRLIRYFLMAIASAVFTLTIIRVQASKIAKQMTYTYENMKIDGGEF